LEVTKMSRAVSLVDLSLQHSSIASQLRDAVDDVFARGDFILGEEVERFEHDFAAYCGARAAVGVDSGTSALELALRAYGCGPGDEVITVPNSFIATALAISHAGATPVFVDVDPVTHTMNPDLLSPAVSPRTKAVVPVHLYGQPAEMDPIMELARSHGLAVIEDACQAHGARYRGRRVGSLGHAAVFSFYPSKNLGALGDGGMVVTNDLEKAEHLRLLRNYGQRIKNHHESVGFNRRLDTLQAALLRVKLPLLDKWNEQRRARAREYSRVLESANIETPVVAPAREHVWHLYVARTTERSALCYALRKRQIQTGVHYPLPIHLQPAYHHLRYPPGSLPIAEQLAGEVLSLPMYPELPLNAVQTVARAVRDCASAARPVAAANPGKPQEGRRTPAGGRQSS
jgi:dTDP-4-amino-4,6-dideoxygalactose transaminase